MEVHCIMGQSTHRCILHVFIVDRTGLLFIQKKKYFCAPLKCIDCVFILLHVSRYNPKWDLVQKKMWYWICLLAFVLSCTILTIWNPDLVPPASLQRYSGHSPDEEAAAGQLWGLSETQPSNCAWDQGHRDQHTWIRPQEAVRWDPTTKRPRAQPSDERAVRLHRGKESVPPDPGQSQRDHSCRDPNHCREGQTCVSLGASWYKWVCVCV